MKLIKYIWLLSLIYIHQISATPESIFYGLIASTSCGCVCWCINTFCSQTCSNCYKECTVNCDQTCPVFLQKKNNHTNEQVPFKLLTQQPSAYDSDDSDSSQDTVIIHESPPPSPERPNYPIIALCWPLSK